ncbi:MAG: alpha/beta hydrolase [Candidatus Paceibacterota bacterium]
MKKILFVVVLLLAATVAQAADRVTVVLVGGAGSNQSHMEFLAENIPNAINIVPDRLWPFVDAAADIWQKIQETGVDGKLILVGHSFGGLISRRIANDHPEAVVAVVTISSPAGGFWACPKWIFRPGDEDSNVPLYVIAAHKQGLEKWFFRGENDGTVDVVSVLDVGREAADIVVLTGLDHMEVLQSEKVVNIINSWIAPRIHAQFASAERILEMEIAQ